MNGPLQERTPVLRVDQSIDEDQRQELPRRVLRETTRVFDLLTNAMKIHLNLEQTLEMNTSTLFVRLETVKNDSFEGKQIQTIGEARLRFPNQYLRIKNDDLDQYYSLRVILLHLYGENERQFFDLVHFGTVGPLWTFVSIGNEAFSSNLFDFTGFERTTNSFDEKQRTTD